jgi:hypothetical protein
MLLAESLRIFTDLAVGETAASNGDTEVKGECSLNTYVLSIHGVTITETALSIVERVLLVKNPPRIVFYRRTTLGLKPSFCKSLVTVAASFSVQKAPTKSLILFLVALFGRL